MIGELVAALWLTGAGVAATMLVSIVVAVAGRVRRLVTPGGLLDRARQRELEASLSLYPYAGRNVRGLPVERRRP